MKFYRAKHRNVDSKSSSITLKSTKVKSRFRELSFFTLCGSMNVDSKNKVKSIDSQSSHCFESIANESTSGNSNSVCMRRSKQSPHNFSSIATDLMKIPLEIYCCEESFFVDSDFTDIRESFDVTEKLNFQENRHMKEQEIALLEEKNISLYSPEKRCRFIKDSKYAHDPFRNKTHVKDNLINVMFEEVTNDSDVVNYITPLNRNLMSEMDVEPQKKKVARATISNQGRHSKKSNLLSLSRRIITQAA